MTIADLLLASALLLASPQASSDELAERPAAAEEVQETGDGSIIVTAPQTEAERRKALREMAVDIIRTPRRGRPIGRFFYPICPKVYGLSDADASVIEAHIRRNAEELGVGANGDPNCAPSIKIGFMADAAGPPTTWLNHDSPSLEHLIHRHRDRVLAEVGPVRAWQKTVVRDFEGRPLRIETGFGFVDSNRIHGPLATNEITGAAVLIEMRAAKGKTLRQLADYATIRSLVGTGDAGSAQGLPAATILTLFENDDAPSELTAFDRSLIAGLYDASINETARRVYLNIAARAQREETPSGEGKRGAAD